MTGFSKRKAHRQTKQHTGGRELMVALRARRCGV